MKTNDPKLFLDEKMFNHGKIKSYLDRYKDIIQKHGSIDVSENEFTAKIYNPNLLAIFNAKHHPFLNAQTNESVFVDGGPYLSTYIKGFIEGEKYFIQHYGISKDTLYGSNSTKYVKDIHKHYYQTEFDNYKGWVSVKSSYPLIFDHKTIRKIGYYSGIVSQVEKLINDTPELFSNFFLKEKEKEFSKKAFPPLPDCFINKNDFKKYFDLPFIMDIYDINNGEYRLKKGRKAYLGCVAQKLLHKGKLIESIESNQDLAKVFCPYFHVKFNSKHEKQFEPERIEIVRKSFYNMVENLV